MKITNEHILTLAEKLKTYVEQENQEQYSNEMIINDVLYFLGISIDKQKFFGADGYDKFKLAVKIALESGK